MRFVRETSGFLLVQSQRLEQQFEAETQRERSARLDEQLYGGTVTNPRDLESLEKEASHARELLEQRDAELLNLSAQAEEAQSKKDSLEKEFADKNLAWEKRQAELESDIKRCTGERDAVVGQRAELAATLDPVSVQRYEGLRKAKKGLAVARVERGLCQACWMALPTAQQQQVRSGRLTVLWQQLRAHSVPELGPVSASLTPLYRHARVRLESQVGWVTAAPTRRRGGKSGLHRAGCWVTPRLSWPS